VLNKAWYEWDSHSPILEAAEGMPPFHIPSYQSSCTRLTLLSHSDYLDITPEQVQAVLSTPPRSTPSLPPSLSAVLRYADAMTLDVRVPDDVFAELKTHFSEREVVEITTTVAAYNCVSRVLVALDVGERNAMSGPSRGLPE
jgi:hypothetical protein